MTRGYCRHNEVVVINTDLRLTKILTSGPGEIANRVVQKLFLWDNGLSLNPAIFGDAVVPFVLHLDARRLGKFRH